MVSCRPAKKLATCCISSSRFMAFFPGYLPELSCKGYTSTHAFELGLTTLGGGFYAAAASVAHSCRCGRGGWRSGRAFGGRLAAHDAAPVAGCSAGGRTAGAGASGRSGGIVLPETA